MSNNEVQERWLPVPGYEGLYEVSDQGRVRSFDRYIKHWRGGNALLKGRILKPIADNKKRERGYLRVGLYPAPRQLQVHQVHVLVLTAFVGPRPDGMVCCHHNGVSTDNRLENLRWDTISANAIDDLRNGANRNATKTHCVNGHEFNASNTQMVGPDRKHRNCRECARISKRARYVPAVRRTHCSEGHELTTENVYKAPDGHRICRTCRNAKQRAYRQA